MTKPGKRVWAGQYYGRTHDGRLHDAPPGDPDAIICRRVADFPRGVPPTGAAVAACTECAAPIALNPARRYTAPLICMQCAHIQPDPLES